MSKKNIIKLCSIVFIITLLVSLFSVSVDATSPKLTHISIRTDKVAPGKKVYMELEGDKANISEININLAGESKHYTCKVLDFRTDEPYFMMPTAANIGETWKISSMVVSYTDNTTESYAKGIGEFLEIDGNDAVIVDYAELKFSSNEVPINGKLPIEIDIPSVPNPYFVTLWLRNSTNDNVNASVMDYNSNPYIVISTKDTGEKVSVGDTYRLVGASVGVQNSGGEMQYLYYGADKSTNIMGEYIYSTNLIIEGTDSLKIMHDPSSLINHVSVLTPRVAPGQKVYLKLEGVNPDIRGLNITLKGANDLYYPCDVIDLDSDKPYFVMPKNLRNGSIWTLDSFRANLADGNDVLLIVDGNHEVQVDYATLELVNYEAGVGEKIYVNLDVPNIQNPAYITMWLKYENVIVNTTINNYGNNPYFELTKSTDGKDLTPGKNFEIIGLSVAQMNSSNTLDYFYYGYANKSNGVGENTEFYSNLIINGRDKVNLIDKTAKLKEISIISDDAIPGQRVYVDFRMNDNSATTSLSVTKMKLFLNEGTTDGNTYTCEVLNTAWGMDHYFIMPKECQMDGSIWRFETAEVTFSDGSKEMYDKNGSVGKVFVGKNYILVVNRLDIQLEKNEFQPKEKVYMNLNISNIDKYDWIGVWLKSENESIPTCHHLKDIDTNPYLLLDTSVSQFNNLKAGDEFIITGVSLGVRDSSDVRFFDADTLVFNINNLIAIVGKSGVSVKYRSHIQDYGWEKGFKWDGQMSGTEGQSKRLEAFSLETYRGDGYVQYKSHIQNIGWEKDWKSNGQISGTEGKALRLEAFQIKLAGKLANTHDIYYRIHVQNFGWLGWAKNGEAAGSQGFGYRAEALQIMLVKKGDEAPKSDVEPFKINKRVEYATHIQDIGWQELQSNGAMAGTEGQSKRLEGIVINAVDWPYEGGITYRTHVQDIGWQGWKSNGEMAGTEGQSKRLEAIEIKLTGELAKHYTVRYRTHIQDIGWQDWKEDGEMAGTEGQSKRLEAIEIKLVKKN